jgi:mRNA interferase RelE/StbE
VPGKPAAPPRSPLYALRVPAHLADLIRGLHPTLKRKLRASLEAIAADPRAGKALKDDLSGLWSFRMGRFRIIYRIGTGRCVELVACGPRERIYEETYRLIMRQK